MIDEVAIRVKNLGKRHKQGQQIREYQTLGKTITRAVKSPFQWLQQFKSSDEREEALRKFIDLVQGEILIEHSWIWKSIGSGGSLV